MSQKYTGGCHCRAVRYEVEADLSSAIECNCSHCCGVQSFGRGAKADGTPTVAINVRCLDGVDLETIHPKKYNGKDA